MGQGYRADKRGQMNCESCGKSFRDDDVVFKAVIGKAVKYYCQRHSSNATNAIKDGGKVITAQWLTLKHEGVKIRKKPMSHWTDDMLRKLFMLYGLRDMGFIAKLVGKKIDSVYTQAKRLGITKHDSECVCGRKDLWSVKKEADGIYDVFCDGCKQDWQTRYKYALLLNKWY